MHDSDQFINQVIIDLLAEVRFLYWEISLGRVWRAFKRPARASGLVLSLGRGQVSRRMPKSMPPFFGWAMRACRSMRNQALAGSVSLVSFGSLRAGCWFRFGVAVRPQLVRSHACPG